MRGTLVIAALAAALATAAGCSDDSSSTDSSSTDGGDGAAVEAGGEAGADAGDGGGDGAADAAGEGGSDAGHDSFADAPQNQLGVVIDASRTSGVAPLAVFFEPIDSLAWASMRDLRFVWDFGDGERFSGFIAAHVFELPPGGGAQTFTVSLTIWEGDQIVGYDTQQIAVAPFSGTTYYVSSSSPQADDQGPGSEAAPLETIAEAWSRVSGPNTRVLLKRGDSWQLADHLTTTTDGPVIVGAYGAGGARPTIHTVASGRLIKVQHEDWRLVDLHVDGDGATQDAAVEIGSHQFLSLRVDLIDVASGYVSDGDGYDFSTHKFIFDSKVLCQHTNFIAGRYIAIYDSEVERLNAGGHNVRIGGGKRVVVAGNTFVTEVAHTSLTVRGADPRRPETEYVLVSGNRMTQHSTVKPQNDGAEEYVSKVVYERNVFVPPAGSSSMQSGLSINASQMIVRNNVFFEFRRAVTAMTHPIVGSSEELAIYNNSHYAAAEPSLSHSFFDGSGADVAVKNNLMVSLATANPELLTPSAAAVTAAHNIAYTPNHTGSCVAAGGQTGAGACSDPQLVSLDPQNAQFMLPGAGGPAVDSGEALPEVFDDHRGEARPAGGGWEVGAFELQ